MSAPTRRGAPFSCPRERKHSAYAWATSSEAGRSLKGPSSPNALMAQWTSQGLSARRASYPRPRESALPGPQTPEMGLRVRRFQVEDEPLLVGVPGSIRHGVSPLEGLLLEQTVAVRRLHADNVGSHGAQEACGPRAYGGPAKIKDVDVVKKTVHDYPLLAAGSEGKSYKPWRGKTTSKWPAMKVNPSCHFP